MTSEAASMPGLVGRPAAPGERMPRHRLRLRVVTGRNSSFAVNASRGGVCIEQMRVLPVGSRIEGSIWLDGGDRRFAGRVAWASTGEHRLNQASRMGVRFDSIDPGFGAGLELHATRFPSRPTLERNPR